jgi:hypothetical protein
VEIRLVDAHTGYVFFSATGTGEASTESGEIAGYGSKANYDSTLNDRAIGAAISDVLSALITKLEERPWRTDILKVDGRTVYISGGSRQGIKVGDVMSIMQQGETVVSAQSGFRIALPAKRVGVVRVVSLFGDNESNEGAVCELVSGGAEGTSKAALYVTVEKDSSR